MQCALRSQFQLLHFAIKLHNLKTPKSLIDLFSWMEHFVVKGKAIPLQVLTGPEGSRRLRLPDFKTTGT
jgi:hypothetical protein